MDIKEYISSGIIEAYVLGLATEEEVSVLDCIRQKHPEVQEAILEAQLLLEDLATEQAVSPAPELKDQIWAQISSLPADVHGSVVTTAADTPAPADIVETDKVVKLPQHRDNHTLAIAATILLAVSLGGNILLYQQREESDNMLAQAEAARDSTQTLLSAANSQWELLQRPSVKAVSLAGVEGRPDLKAVVLWDTQNANVYLTAEKLPAAPQGKQYQLWAIVDGQPVDAGVLPLASTEQMFKMNNIPNAQAFAITLEDEGGKPAPTLSDLYVIGNI
ncbi:anti-sigma factor [Sphingobacterium paludis]|uniref:Anti-sigma-K factor rskA n=1 Tax=Sphingobacterium paludis TaxID=1476465 RepID=A0A4R7D9I1_9SPHI|nr:anti-sigma factor [Sphingobacterium paludis]TDS17407.1 anti-sigma-K factor rskA [Sphingobacterium paludis]